MSENLRRLSAAGVAIWLDDLSRERLQKGTLAAMVRDCYVVGVTTNPSIFQAAVSKSDLYDPQVHDLAVRGVRVDEAVRAITTADVREACDVLRPVYEASGGVDGRVSIEVDPGSAHNTEKSVAEAHALWWAVDRPNLYIKIPGTLAGLPAIAQCLAEGISVNVTLIFSLQRYRAVMEAFLDGMERARKAGLPLERIGSVASFFVSRVDTEIDKRLDKIGTAEAKALRGKAAVANARLAFEAYEEVFGGERWAALAAAGAQPQRPLWASTGVKDPAYPDTLYVDELVAAGVVNTMPETTLNAVADHSTATGDTVRAHYAEAKDVLARLAEIGIDYDDVVDLLEREAVEKFVASWTDLLTSVDSELTRLGADA
ncbi:MAG TPA: transaldolase [Sporichthya sp.]|nr:transaldolase [Sporichthya sp.]